MIIFFIFLHQTPIFISNIKKIVILYEKILNIYLNLSYKNVIINLLYFKEVQQLTKLKKWVVGEADSSRVAEISKKFGISPLVAKIIYMRGIRDDVDIENFIKKDFSKTTIAIASK